MYLYAYIYIYDMYDIIYGYYICISKLIMILYMIYRAATVSPYVVGQFSVSAPAGASMRERGCQPIVISQVQPGWCSQGIPGGRSHGYSERNGSGVSPHRPVQVWPCSRWPGQNHDLSRRLRSGVN